LCEHFSGSHAAQKVSSEVSVHRGDDVIIMEGVCCAYGDSLVAALRENHARDFSLFEKVLSAIVYRASELHPV
jgi:hypothetical protein